MTTRGLLVIVRTERLGGGDPALEYYVVAVADREKAEAILRDRAKLTGDQKVLVFGDAPETTMQFLNAVPGAVYFISAVI